MVAPTLNIDFIPHAMIYCTIGCVTGILTGFTGASGMSVLISILLLMGVPVREVIALTFVVTMANSAVAAVPFGRRGNIPVVPALLMSVAAIAGVFIGYRVSWTLSSGMLGWWITAGIAGAGIKFTFFDRPASQHMGEKLSRFPVWAIILPGIIVGCVIGIVGGGGAVFITLLLVFVFHYPAHKALGISLVVVCAAALPGCLMYARDGYIHASTAFEIILPSTMCAFIAAHWANRIHEATIKRVLGIYLITMSLLLTLKHLHFFEGLSR